MAVVKNLMIRAGADFSPMKKGLDKARGDLKKFNSDVKSFHVNLKNTMAGIGATLAAIGIGNLVKESTKSAMEVEAAMGQIQRSMGGSAQEFMNWADTGAKAFNLGRTSAIKYGAVYSNLLSSFTKDTAETMKYTQELLKATAVVSSATGRNMDDSMERIRSGLLGNTEAIEDLGINVGISMIESTKAFQKFANGKSWDQLNFRTQQTIRYFAILEQATQKYGSTLADNTATRQAALIEQLKDLRTNMGNAFLPIYNAVLPALTSLAKSLSYVMQVMAGFSQALFGKAKVQEQTAQTEAQAGAVTDLGKAYKGAGKAAKGALAGFDEVNTLADGAGAGGLDEVAGSIGGGSSIPIKFETNAESVRDKIEEFAKKFRELLSPLKPYVDRLKEAWGNLKQSVKDLADSPAFKTLKENLAEFWMNKAKGGLLSLAGAFDVVAGAIDILNGVLNGDFSKALRGVEKGVSGTYDIITGILYPFFPEFAKKMEEFKKNFAEKWASLKDDVKKYGDPTKLEASDFASYIRDKVSEKWEELKTATSTKWSELKTSLSTWWENMKTTIGWADIKNTVLSHWESLKNETGTKWGQLKSTISQKWNDISGLKFDDVKNTLVKVWNELKKDTDTIWGFIANSIKAGINSAIDLVNKLVDKVNSLKINVPKVSIPGMGSIGGGSIGLPNIPKIPKLARGGIVDGETNFGNYIAGEAGSEMIVPLENTSFVDKLASALGTAVMSAMQFSQNSNQSKGDIVFQIDGTTIARVLNPHLSKESNRIGGTMITST